MEPLIVTKVVHYEEEFTIERDDEGFLIEPKCEQCHSGVVRPKCFFELGGDCPRHSISEVFRKEMKRPETHPFKPYGYHPEECYWCKKSKEEHIR